MTKNQPKNQTKNKKRPTKRRRAASPSRRPRAKKAAPSAPVPAPKIERAADPVVEPVARPMTSSTEVDAATDVLLATPEAEFAARVLPPEPERPFPTSRRAIFFDVENTSRAEHIARVIDHLAVDRLGWRTELIAVGNWKVIGLDTARLLAQHGAQLVHSAPSTGVRDWSDLRIAVAAGVWLAGARPGDVLEIVSNDRAFDAVGDVGAGLGIAFRRLSYQTLAALPSDEAPVREAPRAPAREPHADRRRRGRRRGRRDAGHVAHPRPPAGAQHRPAVDAPPHTAPRESGAEPHGEAQGEPHTAPHDEIIAVVRDLIDSSPTRSINLDVLANALKARGFQRTSGSPRLITRLRRIREVQVGPSGLITLTNGEARQDEQPAPGPHVAAREGGAIAVDAEEIAEAMPAEAEDGAEAPPAAPGPEAPAGPERRRRRRGGRGRRGRGGGPLRRPLAT